MRSSETPDYAYRRAPDQDMPQPARHQVVVVGAGPVGLALAIDLAIKGIQVLILDDNDRVSVGSRAICFAKRTLEIFDRLGCGDALVAKGVQWNVGKVFHGEQQVYEFDLLPEAGHKRPAFINIQQYHVEAHLLERIRELQAEGAPIEVRGRNKVVGLTAAQDSVDLDVETPDGPYSMSADWLVACDGANSTVRRSLGLDFVGRAFEDNFLIADIVMQEDAGFQAERRFWFDPPFNRGQSALLHKQPDSVWRVDLQLGPDIDRELETSPERVKSRIHAFLGADVEFELDWVSIYTFQCRRMKRFRHGRILFAGDSAHQVSPFGARGANSGLQDADNLAWKLALVAAGKAPGGLLDSYDYERVLAADENILASSRSSDFITPSSEVSRVFRDAVLDLARHVPAMRPMVNSGRLSVPSVYDGSTLNGPNCHSLPRQTRSGAPAVDAPMPDGSWLLEKLGGQFLLLAIGVKAQPVIEAGAIQLKCLTVSESTNELWRRWLGDAANAYYLVRPDQHVAARWTTFNEGEIIAAFGKARGGDARCD